MRTREFVAAQLASLLQIPAGTENRDAAIARCEGELAAFDGTASTVDQVAASLLRLELEDLRRLSAEAAKTIEDQAATIAGLQEQLAAAVATRPPAKPAPRSPQSKPVARRTRAR